MVAGFNVKLNGGDFQVPYFVIECEPWGTFVWPFVEKEYYDSRIF